MLTCKVFLLGDGSRSLKGSFKSERDAIRFWIDNFETEPPRKWRGVSFALESSDPHPGWDFDTDMGVWFTEYRY